MKAKDLKNSILQMAVEGKLVPQDPSDEPASILLERIRAERRELVAEKKMKAPKGGESVIYLASDGSRYEKRGGGEPVCIDGEIPFEVPEGWEWARLESLSSVITDGDHQAPPQVNDGVPFLVISDVSNGGLSFNGTRHVPQSYYDAIDASRKPRAGDLLITVTGSFGITVPVNTETAFCFQRHIALIRPLIFREFLDLALSAPLAYERFKLESSGTAQKTVSLTVLRRTLIPLPSLVEQRRIAARVAELMPLVEQYGALEDEREALDAGLADRLRKSVLQEAVQGRLAAQDASDEPASALLERIRAERAAKVAAGELKAPKGGESVIYRDPSDGAHYEKRGKGEPVCIEDEIPFDIPDTWEWVRLGSLVLNRKQLKPASSFCYIDISSIDNKSNKLADCETVVEAKKAPSRARKPVEVGDVLYATVRPYLHNACIVDRQFSVPPIASTGFAAMVCPDGLVEQYLLECLLSPFFDDYANDLDNSKGVAYPAINDERLYRALIPVPPLAEQRRIIERVDELLALLA